MSDQSAPSQSDQDRERTGDPPEGTPSDHHQQNSRDGKEGKDGDSSDTRKRSGKKPLIILGAVAVLLAIAGLVWWFATRNRVSTDDAYTDGNAITMAPKVSGYVWFGSRSTTTSM
ncbi:hypothetical protein, partial [Moraxella catarrhalis]|uniref:hypothetical protein n=1 Tax=Moraxella catarrhalis TaxID=480 RepID=UPI0022287D6A